jgi:chloride channel protein, CIC family
VAGERRRPDGGGGARLPWRHVVVLVGAGVLTGAGQFALKRLSSSNSVDITEAIWFRAGRLPTLRTLGSALLAIFVVGMGASIGREGAPKQTGAVIADVLSDRGRLSDDERRLLVACGAGAGMAAAYGVPLGGALFTLEVLRGACLSPGYIDAVRRLPDDWHRRSCC